MGYEEGTVFVYKRKLWLFAGYSTDSNNNQLLILHGLHAELVEAKEDEVHFLISPSEIDLDELDNIE